MLMLTRVPGDSIKIGNKIVITIQKIARKKVYLTVSNPKTRTVILDLDQSLTITDDIKIKILSVRCQVRLGIEAPREIKIVRVEIDNYSRA